MLNIDSRQGLQAALEHHQAGRLPQAEAIYRQILAREPNNPDALHLLGMVAFQTGQMQAALDLISRAIAINPSAAEYFNNFGEVWRHCGQPEKAMEAYRRAIALSPGYSAAHSNLGLVLHAQGRILEAIAAFATALQLDPQSASAHCNLGDALATAGKLDQAVAAYRASIALDPRQCNAYNNMGAALLKRGFLAEAETAFRAALAANPNEADVCQNLGDLLLHAHRSLEALPVFQRAIQLDPQRAAAYTGLGGVLKNLDRTDEAIAAYRRAIALNSKDALAYANLGGTLRDRGQLDDAITALRQAVEVAPQLASVHSSLILTLYLRSGDDRKAIAEEQQRWDERFARPLASTIAPHVNDPSPERRLRIAYLSPDFREHPVGRFMLPLLAHHDRQRHEVICYSTTAAPDALSRQLRPLADQWEDVAALDEDALAAHIRNDRIDILVDLAMHTVDNRLLTLARKPAPVQISYLATCDGSGLSTMDYRITDPYVDPPDAATDHPYERPLRLPHTYWCYQPALEAPPVNPLPASAAGYITFGCLNHFSKITPAGMDTWCRLLRRMPAARFILHVPAGSPQQRVRDMFQKGGVDTQRLELVPRVSAPEYFKSYQRIDIGLDPYPCVGGTTTCDALWMGVPVVSRSGQVPTSRGGLSILSNVGLPEFVAHTSERYLLIAEEWASDLPRLARLRSELRQRMRESPLTDAPTFATNMEHAYRSAWRQWCGGGKYTP